VLRQAGFRAAALVVALIVAACGSDVPDETSAPDYWPTEEWRIAMPADRGFDSAAFQQTTTQLAIELPFLDSLVVVRDGYLIYEGYFNGYDAGKIHNVASVTKSWTSAAVGIAQDRHDAVRLDATLATLLPEHFAGEQRQDKAKITLRHLLEMRSGIDFREDALNSGEYGSPEELAARDLTALALEFPVAHKPGEAWNYSTLDTQLLSAATQRALGKPLEAFVRESLFEPMGIRDYHWFADGAGTTVGGQDLSLTPRDMAKLGLLYLNGGEWDGTQLVPSRWVETSTAPQGREARYREKTEVIQWYGHHWWTWGPDWYGGYAAFQAKGYAGQQILVLPELNLVVVTTANTHVAPEAAAAQEEAIYHFLRDRILPTVREAEGAESR